MKQGPTIIEADPSTSLLEDESEGLAGPEADAELREVQVPASLHGQRVDRVLASLLPEFSRNYLQQLVDDGALRQQGRVLTRAAHRVKAGEVYAIELRPTPQSMAFRPEPLPLDVRYEDAHLLVLDKPAGLVVHPAPGNWSGTLLNALLARDPQAASLPRAGIVHRLDKDTSGLMVVARTRAAMDALVKAIAARTVTRQYLAIGQGAWRGEASRLVEAPIGRDPRNRLRMAVVDLQRHPGKPAATTLDLLAGGPQACLVRASLHTGRTHQIRVHMAQLGHPLLGDVLYGGPPVLVRQALHAFRLAFTHPVTGESLDLGSALPPDLRAALPTWGLDYNPAIPPDTGGAAAVRGP